jgi:hypothetical protein
MTYRRLFLMLLCKYLLSDRAHVEIDKENEEDGEDAKFEARATYMAILVNTVQFATNIVANGMKRNKMGEAGSGADCLFGPSLVEGTAREVQRINESQMMATSGIVGDQATSVGVLVYQLKKASTLLLATSDKISKLSALAGGPAAAAATPVSTTSNASSPAAAWKSLAAAKREKKLLADVVEGCVFLVERHLHYYLVEAAASVSATSGTAFFSRSSVSNTPKVTRPAELRREDLVQLKSDMNLALGDSLFSSLKDVASVFSADRRDPLFLDTQTNRLRRLAARHST